MKNRLPLSNTLFVLVLLFLYSQNSYAQGNCGDGMTDDMVTVTCSATTNISVFTADEGCSYTITPADLTTFPVGLDVLESNFIYDPNPSLIPNIFIDMPMTAQTINAGGSIDVVISGQFFDPGDPAVCLGDGYCTYTITLVDNVAPAITCPASITVNTAGACTGAVASLIATADPDDCGTVTITNDSPFAFNNDIADAAGTYDVGVTTVTFTATDNAGNASTCTATVTVLDEEDPVITSCPGNTMPTFNAGASDEDACGTDVIVTEPSFTDNCSATLTNSFNGTADADDFYPVGTTTVVFTVTDASGNAVATCSQDIVVVDQTDPTITCPPDVTVDADPDACFATVAVTIPTATDNCGIASVINDFNGEADASDEYPIGITTVTYTATDDNGRTATCQFTVTVEETVPPVLDCPGTITENTDAGSCTANLTIPMPGIEDNCPGTSVAFETTGSTTLSGMGAADGVYNKGTTVVTYTVTDNAGNTASCSFEVIVNDGEDPVVTCPSDMTVPASPAGSCGAVVNGIAPTFSDNCGATVTYTLSGATTGSGNDDASGTTFNGGTTTVTYIATDGVNQTSCSFTITVNDTQPPAITCPGDTPFDTEAGECYAVVSGLEPTVMDNCPTVSLEYVLTGATTGDGDGNVNGLEFNEGVTTVEYTATDVNGSFVTCTFDVTVEDNEAPTITCPTDVEMGTDDGVCTAVVNNIAPAIGEENCPGDVTVSYVITGETSDMGTVDASGTTFELGESIVTYTVTDEEGNINTCAFTVNIFDDQAPEITCSENITIGTDGTIIEDPDGIVDAVTGGTCEATIDFDTPIGTDNCASPTTTQTDMTGLASGDAFPVGTTTLEYTVTDGAGAQASCTFTVTVVDGDPPSITNCPTDAAIDNDAGMCEASYTWTHPTYNDACPGGILEMQIGTLDVITVTTLQGLDTSFDFPEGTTTVTYTATDAGNNTDVCSFMVTVTDTEAPEITCLPNVTDITDPGVCGANLQGLLPDYEDNCAVASLTYTISGATNISSPATGINDASDEFFNEGLSTVTYTVTDEEGLTASCSFTIDITDAESPEITCPVDMVVNTDMGDCTATFSAGDLELVSSEDNCGVADTEYEVTNPDNTTASGTEDASAHVFQLGTSTVVYTVTDDEGNEAVCSFTVTVQDMEDPTIMCPSDIAVGTSGTVTNSGGLGVALTTTVETCSVTLDGIGAINPDDNCVGETVRYVVTGATTAGDASDDASGTTFNLGVSTVTYTITDAAGNTSSCSFDVTVTDDVPPQMEQFPIDRVVSNDPDDCGAIVNGIDPFLIDDCPNPELVTTVTSILPDGTVIGPEVLNDDAAGYDFPVGTSYVVYELIDMAGNEVTFVTDENGDPVTASVPPVQTGFTTPQFWFTVTVNDTEAPMMVTDAQDSTVECNGTTQFSAFETWFNNRAGFTADDNCSVEYQIFDPTTSTWVDVATLDATTYYNDNWTASCAAAGSIDVQWRAIDVGFLTVASSVATFTIEDTSGPNFLSCPDDVTIATRMDGTGDCATDYTFGYPTIADSCTPTTMDCGTMAMATLTSADPGNEIVLVDEVTLSFAVNGAPTTATTQVSLSIDFEGVDAELPTEFFFVKGEDGTALGTTLQTSSQCNATAETVFTTTIAPAIFNQWALDGVVEFILTPNDPGAGNEEDGINDICPNGAGGGSIITGTLDYDCENLAPGFLLTYAVNGGTAVQMLPMTAMTMPPSATDNFGLGENTVVFTATDCSGNTNTCSFTVTVEDDEPPAIVGCTAPVLVNPPAADCDPNDYELQRPTGISDNCEVGAYSQRLVQDILFTEHPNIDGYAANDMTFAFTMATPPPPLGMATLEVTVTGDINNAGEYFDIVDEAGNVLGSTTVTGGTACPSTSTVSFTMPLADVLTMAADGTINIQAIAHGDDPVMASNDGDWSNEDFGINPIDCPPLTTVFVDAATPGQNPVSDGTSTVSMRLIYDATTVRYSVSGVTTINETDFPEDGSNPTVTLNPGMNTITYYATDLAGNTGTCTQTITVGNPSIASPTLTVNANPGQPSCPGDFVVLDASGYTYDTNDPPIWTWYLDNAPFGVNDNNEDMIVATTEVPSLTFQALEGSNNYYVEITDNFCFSTPSNSVTINGGVAPPVPQIFASPNPVCSGDDFGLFIANPNTLWTSYVWEGTNGYQFNGQFPPAITGANNTATTNDTLIYILTVTNSAGCTASATTQVQVRPVPETPFIQSNSPVCNGEDLVLSSNSECETYVWIGPDGSSSSTLTNPLLQTQSNTTTIPADDVAYDAGVWSVICIDANGCEAESETIDVVISNPIAAAPSNNGPACAGEPLQLTVGSVTNAISYEWMGPNGFMSSNQNPVISNPSTASAGTYTVTITDANGCTGSGSTEVEVSNIPVITAISVNPDANSCVNGETDITLNPSIDDGDGLPGDTGAPYTYQWTGENGFTSTSMVATLPNGTSADNGSYVLVVENAAGCASEPFTIVVDVRDEPNTPTLNLNENTLCEGDALTMTTQGYNGTNVSYQWLNGTNVVGTTTNPSFTIDVVDVNDAGSYSVVVTVDGCTSNASQVIPVTVNTIPSMPSVSGPTAVCEGEVLQLGTTFIAGAQYVWTGPNGFTASVFNPSVFPVTAASAGGYSVQIIINGCASEFSEPLNVSVNEAPNAPTITSNGPICIDETGAVLTLSVTSGTATPGATYEWFDAQTNNALGMSGLSTNFNLTDFSNYGDGVFEFYVVARINGCASSSSVPTSVVMNSIPNQVAFAGDDQEVCDGLSVNLNADAPIIGTGMWTQISGDAVTVANPTAANTSVTGLVAGNAYSFRWTLSNGACDDYSSDDVQILVNSANQMAEAGTQVDVCNATSANLAAVPPNSGNVGTWTQSPTQSQLGVTIADPNDPNTEVTGLVSGNTYQFTWTLSNDACGDFSVDIVEVDVENAEVSAYAGEDATVCGADATADIFAEGASDCTGRWSSASGTLIFANANSSATVVSGLQPGNNVLTWTVDCGACGETSDEVVIFYEAAASTVPDVANVGFGESIAIDVLTNDNLPEDYTVTLIDAPEYGTLSQTGDGVWTYTHEFSDATPDMFTYQVCNVNCEDVCSSVTAVNIIVEVSDDCIVPTIITPNGDGVNDAFAVECLFASGKYPNNRVIIYNQWGDEIFRATNYQNNWEGTYNGEDVPVGTYFYFVDLGDGSEPLTGFLEIER